MILLVKIILALNVDKIENGHCSIERVDQLESKGNFKHICLQL
jgi:hypothetical protein